MSNDLIFFLSFTTIFVESNCPGFFCLSFFFKLKHYSKSLHTQKVTHTGNIIKRQGNLNKIAIKEWEEPKIKRSVETKRQKN